MALRFSPMSHVNVIDPNNSETEGPLHLGDQLRYGAPSLGCFPHRLSFNRTLVRTESSRDVCPLACARCMCNLSVKLRRECSTNQLLGLKVDRQGFHLGRLKILDDAMHDG